MDGGGAKRLLALDGSSRDDEAVCIDGEGADRHGVLHLALAHFGIESPPHGEKGSIGKGLDVHGNSVGWLVTPSNTG